MRILLSALGSLRCMTIFVRLPMFSALGKMYDEASFNSQSYHPQHTRICAGPFFQLSLPCRASCIDVPCTARFLNVLACAFFT